MTTHAPPTREARAERLRDAIRYDAAMPSPVRDCLLDDVDALAPSPTVTAELVRRGILATRWPNGDRLDGITSRTVDMLTVSILHMLHDNGIEVSGRPSPDTAARP